MNEEEMRKDILFDIEMQLYAEFNDTIATMNDHLGEIYGYSDVENVKQLEQQRKIELTEKAIKQLQNNWNELKKWLESWLENEKHCYLAENPSDKCRCEVYKELLDKMQELEGNNE